MPVPVESNQGFLPFITPTDICCNCGTPADLKTLDVNLKKKSYFLLAGVEYTFKQRLSFCSRCASTANRYRPSMFERVLVAFGIFWVFFLAILIAEMNYPGVDGYFLGLTLFQVSVILAGAVTFGFYKLRRPGSGQTSFYQPVSLVSFKISAHGLQRVELAFTNEAYMSKFSALNHEFVGAGLLGVRHT